MDEDVRGESHEAHGAAALIAAEWAALGVESMVDKAGMFTSEDQVRAHFSTTIWSEATLDIAVAEWQAARVEADYVVELRGRQLAETCTRRGSRVPPRRHLIFSGPPLVRAPTSRKLVIDAVRPQGPRVASVAARKRAKVEPDMAPDDALLEEVFSVYLVVGEQGRMWMVASTEREERTRRDLILQPVKKLDSGRVKLLLGTLRRWQKWVQEKPVAEQIVINPPPLLFGEWILQVASGGPWAAKGVLHNIQWWVDTVGTPFPCELECFTKFKQATSAPKPRALNELQPCLFFAIAALTVRARGSIAIFGRLFLFLVTLCLRWKHQLRSRVTRWLSRLVVVECAKGKKRVQGERPPFSAAAPRFLLPQVDVLGPVKEFYDTLQREFDFEITFLIPDVEVERGGALRPDSRWLPHPMPYTKFLRLSQGLALQAGAPPSVASEIRYKTLRRCLPSGADSLDMDDTEAQSVSNWQEVPRTAVKRSRAATLMSKTYAGDKVLTAGETKLTIIVAAWQAGLRASLVTPPMPVSFDPSWVWSVVRLQAPAREELFQLTRDRAWGVGGSPSSAALALPPVVEPLLPIQAPLESAQAEALGSEVSPEKAGGAPKGMTPGSGESSEAESSCTSDAESIGSEASVLLDSGDLASDSVDLGEINWFLQASHARPALIHFVEEHDVDGLLVPWCRERPFVQPPVESGFGAREAAAVPHRPCSRCLKRMPAAVSIALQEALGD